MESYNKAFRLVEANTTQPCPHCGKPDWCYMLGELSVCKREADPAAGWQQTSKKDKDGTPYYAPITPQKEIRPAAKKDFFYPSRDGQRLVKVTRSDDGQGNRKFYQSHWNGQKWLKELPQEIAQQVPLYRYQQVRKAIASGRLVFLVEGEGCADMLFGIGLVATTNLGGSGKFYSYGDYSEDLAGVGANLVLCPDRDQPGLKHMEEVAKDFPLAQWLYAPPGDYWWQHLAKSGGLDIADWIKEGATAEDIRAGVQPRRVVPAPATDKVEFQKISSRVCTGEENLTNLTVPPAEEIFTQKAEDALFSEVPWIALNGSLYRWTGTHYQLSPNAKEKSRIAQWCHSTPVQGADSQWRYTYAKANYIEAIWNWLILKLGVSPDAINPAGINCLNGFLEISWQGMNASWKLLPHDAARLCTYVSEISFDPDADVAGCEKLLACLNEPQQRLFLQTLAASLDLPTIRRYRGRAVRALLCKGHGNNGKDSLREAVRLLYGIGLSNATISDFQTYDQGRKFSLAKLESARINWSSENSSFSNLDGLQSLKAAITGDPLDIERKFADEQEMNPAAIFLFNINEAPNLKAGLEAIQSRWAVLSFTKTYKIGADPTKGELEADSRFRYDPDFLKSQVVPALLNKMLEQLNTVAGHGIDYTCTEQALQAIQQEVNHLWAFAQQVGLGYCADGRVYINDLWEVLRDWYIANGTLAISVDGKGKEKAEWHDQPRRGDKNVKAANQVHQRFTELFPKVVRLKDTSRGERTGQAYLAGIGFAEVNVEAIEPVVEANVEPMLSQLSVTQSDVEAVEPINPTLAYALAIINRLSPESQKLLREELLITNNGLGQIGSAGSTSSPERVTGSTTASTFAPTASTTGSTSPAIGSSTVSEVECDDFVVGNSIKNFPHPNLPDFKVGDQVAHADPSQKSHNWHGTVVGFEQVEDRLWVNVRWKELRKGPLAYRLCDLRHI